MILWKCCTQHGSKFGKLSSGHRTGKGQFSFPTQIRAMPRMHKLPHKCTHLTVTQVMLKSLQAKLYQYVNCELPDVQPGFRKGRRTRDQIANIHWIIEKAREFQKNSYFCFIDYAKAFDGMDHNKLWKFFKSWENQTTLPASWEICIQIKKQQLEPSWNNRLVPNWERSISRLYIVTLLI